MLSFVTETGIKAKKSQEKSTPLNLCLKAYIRHKGFMDGFPGFVFALFSSLRFPIAYIKLWGKNYENRS